MRKYLVALLAVSLVGGVLATNHGDSDQTTYLQEPTFVYEGRTPGVEMRTVEDIRAHTDATAVRGAVVSVTTPDLNDLYAFERFTDSQPLYAGDNNVRFPSVAEDEIRNKGEASIVLEVDGQEVDRESFGSSDGTLLWTNYEDWMDQQNSVTVDGKEVSLEYIDGGAAFSVDSVDTSLGEELAEGETEVLNGIEITVHEYGKARESSLNVANWFARVSLEPADGSNDGGSTPSSDVRVSLDEGWNLISVPRQMSLEDATMGSACDLYSWDRGSAWTLSGGDWQVMSMSEDLNPVKGYYVWNSGSNNCVIDF